VKHRLVPELKDNSCRGCCFYTPNSEEKRDCSVAVMNCLNNRDTEAEDDRWIVIENTPEDIARYTALRLGVKEAGT